MASFLLPSSLFLLLLFLLFSTPAASWLPKKPPPLSSGEAPLPCLKTHAESLNWNPKGQIRVLGMIATQMADEEHAKEWKQVNGKLMPPKAKLVFREVMSVQRITCADNNKTISFALEIRADMGFEEGVLHANLYVDPSAAFRLGLWMYVTA
ncbi:hypothetical protein AXF42_Ash014417 [Apostasia shenzhenica]|uniref:Uncharacterized protein n=1 Tax=Apostasia shenzhenica TaxID=1088818 RepID=A0A2I0B128_9ASPA|nr:hypothetical protein AXF42_Ash014417 [Apostasia shenzhenica]